MILKEVRISSFQVGWDSKANGIKKISEELNIGLDSIIFIDDSYNEINEVRALMPEVDCVLFNKRDIYTNIKLNLSYFVDIKVIEKRHKTYMTNMYRKEIESYFSTHDEF